MLRYKAWMLGLSFAFIVIILGSLYASLRVQDAENVVESEYEQITKSISLRLNWIPDPTFTGAYIAKQRKIWEQLGLSVSIEPGGMNLDPIRLVSNGTNQFGVVGANRLLQARSEGFPVRAVCVEMREHPVGWLVLDDSPISTFQDFAGKKIGIKVGDESDSILQSVLAVLNIDRSEIEEVPVGFSVDPLLNGLVDALPVYVNEEPHTVRARGFDVRVLRPSEIGITLYGNVIIVNEELIENSSELVDEFVSGLIQGWNAAYSNEPDSIVQDLIAAEPQMAEVPTEEVLKSTLNLVFNGSELGVCQMEISGWERSRRLLEEHADLQLNESIENVFYNESVEKYYSENVN